MSSHPTVGVYYNQEEQKERAARLAAALDLPLTTARRKHDLVLEFHDNSLRLCMTSGPMSRSGIQAEFVRGAAAHRRKQGGREQLRRALGVHPQRPFKVLDATGGLGRDAFLMALYGCRVDIFERNIVVAALLADGLRRAWEAVETRTTAERINLYCRDCLAKFREMNRAQNGHGDIDVIYLDPMFPQRTKSALVKKEMQILQALLGYEDNGPELLEAALNTATGRVVVKRPARAEPLVGPVPSHSISGKTTRFDVYLIT